MLHLLREERFEHTPARALCGTMADHDVKIPATQPGFRRACRRGRAASNDYFFTSFRARARGLVVLERRGVKELGRAR